MKNYQGTETLLKDYLPYVIAGGVFSLPALTGSFVWLCFLAPLPVFYYLSSLGQDQGTKIIIRAAVAAGILAIISKVMPVLIFSLSMVPVGFILAGSVKKKESPILSALKAALFVTAAWSLLAIAVGSAHHVSLYGEILNNIDIGLLAAFENYKLSAELPPATLVEIEAAFTELRLLIPKIFPGMLLMVIAFTVWANLVSGDWLLKRKSPTLSSWESFRHWRLPEQLVWGVIISGLLLFMPGSLLSSIGLNVLMVLGLIYFFQGLAVMTFLLGKWAFPVPVKVFLYVLLVVQAYGMLLIAVLGLADVWLEFRKPRPEANDLEDK